eukprot:4568580-Pyramimonas_sp.AAC.1
MRTRLRFRGVTVILCEFSKRCGGGRVLVVWVGAAQQSDACWLQFSNSTRSTPTELDDMRLYPFSTSSLHSVVFSSEMWAIKTGMSPTARPADLTMDKYVELYRRLHLEH